MPEREGRGGGKWLFPFGLLVRYCWQDDHISAVPRFFPKKKARQNGGITCSRRCDSANQSENVEREAELQLGGMAGDRDLRSRNGRMARRGLLELSG